MLGAFAHTGYRDGFGRREWVAEVEVEDGRRRGSVAVWRFEKEVGDEECLCDTKGGRDCVT